MSAKSRSKYFYILLISCTIPPLLFISSNKSAWNESKPIVSHFQELIYLPEVIIDSAFKAVKNSWNSYIANINASKENKKLKTELLKLESERLNLQSTQDDLERLKKVLHFSQKLETEHIIAEVIGSDSKFPFQSIRINRGKKDGIEVGMPVINNLGIIGRTIRAGYFYSDVQVLTDPNFNLDVISERSRTRGALSGHPTGKVTLNLQKKADLKVGDTLVTSGILGAFPKGLPVATIVQINFSSDDVTQKVFAAPFVDHRSLEEVIVIKKIAKNVEGIIDTAGYPWINNTVQPNKGSKG